MTRYSLETDENGQVIRVDLRTGERLTLAEIRSQMEARATAEWPASRLRQMAIDWLRKVYPTCLIVPELSVASWGGAMLDVAAITDTKLIGVEIKGDGDSASRLALQGIQYSCVCDAMYLLPSPSLHKSALKKRPPMWGLLEIIPTSTGPGLEPREWLATSSMPTSPHRLLEMLHTQELKRLTGRFKTAPGKFHVDNMRHALAEAVPLKELRAAVLLELRGRDFSKFNKWTDAPLLTVGAT